MVLDTVRNKVWSALKYQCKETNCGNCAHSSNWVKDLGKCNVLTHIIFDVIKVGICKLHSAFGGGNIRHDINKLHG